MKIVVAPDKFKGSLTGLEFCDAVEEGLNAILQNPEILKMPLADGGDGTIEILDYHLKGEHIKVIVSDPLFRPIKAAYFFIPETKTAFVEMAEASGMKLLNATDQNCMNTSTFGTGELILDAIQKGANNIVIGIGGSATNDCGIGMAAALGFKFLDKLKEELKPIGRNLIKIDSIDYSQVIKELKNVQFKVACDVTNPLFGENGAAYVYASQKGASELEVELLDKGLRNLADIFLSQFKTDVQKIEGGGAAGGMGVGTKMFLNAALTSGIDLIKEMIGFDAMIKDADWIITGEGKLDSQTLSGKTIKGVLDSATEKGIPVAAFCGSTELTELDLKQFGINYADSVITRAINLDDAIANAYSYLKEITVEFINKKA